MRPMICPLVAGFPTCSRPILPQTALANSAAAKVVPQAATDHARLSQLARVETQRVVSARNIGDVMLVENVGAEHREIQREVENAGPVQIEIEQGVVVEEDRKSVV